MTIQHFSQIVKDIVCTIIRNSASPVHGVLHTMEQEVQEIARMYEIIYCKVENLRKKILAYKKQPTKFN